MEIVENKLLVLRTRSPQKYAAIPRSKDLGPIGGGLHEVAVYWGLDEARVLRNLGVRNVPSPIRRDYDWPLRRPWKPMAHQIETADFLTMYRRCFCFNEPGTAKTISALWAADYLMRIGRVRRALILCPLSIMRSAWCDDAAKSVLHRSIVACHHTDSKRRIAMVKKGYDFVVVNYDGLPLIKKAILEDGTFDLIIVDEANAYKNPSTDRWRALNALIDADTMVWMMTGTPAAQSPEDAFGLAKIVNPTGVPLYMSAWRDKVMNKITKFKYIPKANAKDIVHAALQPAIRFTKAECLDLPPVMTETREVDLTPQQRKYYVDLTQRMVVHAAGETISAVHKAAELNKLLQISAGAAYTDNHEVLEFDCSSRLAVLKEILEETDKKVLVFAHFRHSGDTIQKALEKWGIPSAQIHGDINANKRAEIFKRFQDTDEPRVLVIQPKAASHGVTLTRADTVIFWSPVDSVDTYIQCVARSDRQGQTSDKVRVIHIQGSPVEKQLYDRLERRLDDHNLLVQLYEEVKKEVEIAK